MKANFTSTSTLLNSARSTSARIQTDLAKANIEINKGRYADVGLELGYKTGTTLDLRQQISDIAEQAKRNALTNVRLGDSQNMLNQVRLDGEAFLTLIASGKLTDSSGSVVAQAAASKLSAFVGQMNASTGGQFLFSGINSSQPPIADYESTPQSKAKTAFAEAFKDKFKFYPGAQPNSSQISAAQMQDFLDNDVAKLFSMAKNQWNPTWSSASDKNIRNEIGSGEIVTTSTNANAESFRQLAMIYTIGSDIGLASLGPAAQSVVYDKMRSVAGYATVGVTQIQADLGAVEARITTLGNQLDAQSNTLTGGMKALEGVDAAEAKSRVDSLTTLLQISYSLTSQTRKLSLIDYV